MEAYKTKNFEKPEELVEFLNTNPSVSVVAITDNSDDNEKEICSCDSYVVGYEDENGRECTSTGTYVGKEVSNGNTRPQS